MRLHWLLLVWFMLGVFLGMTLLVADPSSPPRVEGIAARQAIQSSARAASPPERLIEFRAVWVQSAYGPKGWTWEQTAKTLHDYNFNAVIVNMQWPGLAHYPTEILPVAERVKTDGDQIAEALKWCKQYGLELHVWKVNYNLSHASPEFVDKMRREGRLQRHKDGTEVTWLCPSDPRNFKLERDATLEIVRKYPVDGIHLDYIRYPDQDACYCEHCRERFQEAYRATIKSWPEEVVTGRYKEQYQQWRQEQITRLVRAVSTEAHKIRPKIKVSAAVFRRPRNERVGQAWKRWIDEGLLDFVCPMNYTTDFKELEQLVTDEVAVINYRIPLYIGIGEFIIPKTTDVINQILLTQKLGTDGFVLFCFDTLAPNTARLANIKQLLVAPPTKKQGYSASGVPPK